MSSCSRSLAVVALWVLAAAMPALADVVPTGVRATSARAEADAFAALEEKRDCDAARAFLLANSLAPDGRLVVNAALALERHGARAQALALFERVDGTPAGVVADVDAHIVALAAARTRDGGGAVCLDRDIDAADATGIPGEELEGPSSSPFLPAGIAALAGGLVVAGSTAGTMAWLQLGVIQSATSSGDAKDDAIAAVNPVLWTGTSIASVLVVAGAVLVPLSFVEELQ